MSGVADILASPTTIPEEGGSGGEMQADEKTRVRLGASADTTPDMLRLLASDPAITVRAAVALNAAAPASVDRILMRDGDTRVRALLARKLATLLPTLKDSERARLQRHTFEILGELVADTAVRVRAAIADVVKEMPEAPRDLILRLSHDSEVPVSEPVVRLSPLLTTEDLLELLAANPNPETPRAVARRRNLNEEVSDVVAASSDSVAICALLSNHSAAIREATLDALTTRASTQTAWHAPLVHRPRLSATATRALSGFVATQLLDELSSRADLPADLARELRARLTARLDPPATASPPAPSLDDAMAEARRLAMHNQIDEARLLDTIQNGDTVHTSAMLAVAAGVPAAVVERATTLRSSKALVSLVWRAGFSMKIAGPLQTLLADIPPHQILRGGPGGLFPLAIEEMRWQIDFLMRMNR